jgi:hypothetical protein
MTATRQPTYWCANFDFADALDHGLRIDAWLLQYQYEHGGFEYQGNRRQKGRTTATWKSLREVELGDWLIAYLSGNAFFAVGQVVEPKPREWQSGVTEHFDTVGRTVRDGYHLHFDGIVRYRDAPAFYEDFTDDWNLPTKNRGPDYPDFWPYAQRIDVAEWQHVVPDGVNVSGLATAAPLPLYRRPLFHVDADFFARVRGELQSACATV